MTTVHSEKQQLPPSTHPLNSARLSLGTIFPSISPASPKPHGTQKPSGPRTTSSVTLSYFTIGDSPMEEEEEEEGAINLKFHSNLKHRDTSRARSGVNKTVNAQHHRPALYDSFKCYSTQSVRTLGMPPSCSGW